MLVLFISIYVYLEREHLFTGLHAVHKFQLLKVYDGDTILVTTAECFPSQSGLTQSTHRATGVYSSVNEDSERANNAEISQVRKSYQLDSSCKEYRVRLLGIDAPESTQGIWGLRATERLRELLPYASDVYLEYDVLEEDKYGRKLAYVSNRDKEPINKILLQEGLAELFTIGSNRKYLLEFKRAEALARTKAINIWNINNGLTESPYQFRKKHKKKSNG